VNRRLGSDIRYIIVVLNDVAASVVKDECHTVDECRLVWSRKVIDVLRKLYINIKYYQNSRSDDVTSVYS